MTLLPSGQTNRKCFKFVDKTIETLSFSFEKGVLPKGAGDYDDFK